MPTVKITSTAGPAKIAYSISTPSKVEAKEIDKKLPCLVLLVRFLSFPSSSPGESRAEALMDSDLGWVDLQHPVFCASEIWHRPSPRPSIQPSPLRQADHADSWTALRSLVWAQQPKWRIL